MRHYKDKANPPGKRFKFQLKNPITGVKVSQVLSRVNGALGTMSELANVVNDMGPAPGLRNYIALGIVAMSKAVGAADFNPHDDPRFVVPAVPWEIRTSLRRIYGQLPNTRMMDAAKSKYQITELDDGNIVVFQCSTGEDSTGALWFVPKKPMKQADIQRRIGIEVWKVLGTRIEVAVPESFFEDKEGEVQKWVAGEILESDQTEKVYTYLKKFLDQGHSRSIVLYGRPGTGKSCMVRAIVARMAAPTLYLEQRQVASMGSYSLYRLLELFRPEVLVIDDFDRIPFLESFLSSIDMVRSIVKLFIVTMNNKSNLDPAVVRAGRFTDQIEVKQIRQAGDIIPEVNGELLVEINRDWPVAFIDELRVRIDVLGLADATSEQRIAEMRQRVIDNAKEVGKKAETTIKEGAEDAIHG